MNLKSIQKELEIATNKNQLKERLTKIVNHTDDIQNKIQMYNLDSYIAEQLCVQLMIHKRITFSSILGMLYFIYKDADRTSEEIINCLKAGLATIDIKRQELVVKYDLTEEQQKEVDTLQFPLPMLVEPKFITKNNENGYYFVKHGSIILNSKAPKYDVNLEHINRVNSIPLSINNLVAQNIPNVWKNSNSSMSRKNHAKYTRIAKDYCNLYATTGNKFYMTHKYDKRGRIYDVGYFINPQGNDWNKACIELYKKEMVI